MRSHSLLFTLFVVVVCACSQSQEPGVSIVPDINEVTGGDTSPPSPDSAGDSTIDPDGQEPRVFVPVPCTENNDCDSGWCVETADGKMCTATCIGACPKDWFCGQVTNTGTDVTFICLPRFVTLCSPCQTNAECAAAMGSTGASCISYGDAGSFCGAECGEIGECPEGYECVASEDGNESSQCVRTDGVCECSWKAIKDGAHTTCSSSSELGSCDGARSCLNGELSACDAPDAAAETCDGSDNDCDGEVDEETDGVPCSKSNDSGECQGVEECTGGSLICTAAVPEVEACDGKDNNCDGLTDEGFEDSNQDGVADCMSDDDDGDGVPDSKDNCPLDANSGQEDMDGDDLGDVCDPDIDGDGDPNLTDCAPTDPAVGSKNVELCNGVDDNCNAQVDEGFPDLDGDGLADCVDGDDDGDGVDDGTDNCPVTANAAQTDSDKDGIGDACENDSDGDGDPDLTDCAPLDPAVFHGADELCNGADENCNGIVDEGYPDIDGDGVANCIDSDDDGDGVDDGTDNCPVDKNPGQADFDSDGQGNACDTDDDNDGDPDALDCAPLNAAVNHSATETCNGVDDDCNGVSDGEDAVGCQDFFFNEDGDGYGQALVKKCLCAAAPPYSATQGGDCNDNNPAIFPGATEVCNLKDDNCNSQVDEGAAVGCQDAWSDGDGDNFGTGDAACVCPGTAGYASQGGDCDDGDVNTNPNAIETCDTKDNNCNGLKDEEDALGCKTYYLDSDGDGYGKSTAQLCLCAPKGDYTTFADGDCDDSDSERFPGNPESCDQKDNNCNGQVDEGVQKIWYIDDDGDGWGASYNQQAACVPPQGFVAKAGDCNDFNKQISPAAPELCDEIDNNCNGQKDEGLSEVKVYVDLDGDGYGAAGTLGVLDCLVDDDGDGKGDSAPKGYALTSDDCNDSAATAYPNAKELCDGQLNDCTAPVLDYQCPSVCPGTWPVYIDVTNGYVAVAQMDADNPLEIVAQGHGEVHVLRHDGSTKWAAPASVQYSHPLLADMNLDGTMDVVLIENSLFRILDGDDGTELESYPVVSSGWRAGAAFDLDNDGNMDLVGVGSSKLSIVLRDGSGGAKTVHEVAPPAGAYFNGDVVGVLDVDGDGIAEVIMGTGYSTCNGANAPACNGLLLVIDPVSGQLKYDPTQKFVVGDADFAYAGGPVPLFADVDSDGEDEVLQWFGNKKSGSKLWVWNLDGSEAQPTAGNLSSKPMLAPVDVYGVLQTDGLLRDIRGGAVDLTGDGDYETVTAAGALVVKDNGETMDGFPVTVPGGPVRLADINKDGRLDILYVGSGNASVNCYTLGEQTYKEERLLTLGAMDAQSANRYRTGGYDPYEPNNIRVKVFDPQSSKSPIKDSRAFPMKGFLDKYSSSSGFSRRLRGLIGTKGDRDYYYAKGKQINVILKRLAGSVDYDLYLHMFTGAEGNATYITTWNSTKTGSVDSIYCHHSTPCPDLQNTGTKTFIIEVRPKDEAKDFGPWPYELRIVWGAS